MPEMTVRALLLTLTTVSFSSILFVYRCWLGLLITPEIPAVYLFSSVGNLPAHISLWHQAVGVAPKKVISKSKTRGFFKRKPAYSRRERRKEYCLARAVARRYPTDRTTTNKRVLGRKIRRGRDSPCINFLTEILPGPALAVFAFQPAASNSHNAVGFKSLRNTKQLVLLPKKLFLNLKRGDFFKQKPAYSRRERRKEYCHTRAVARRYPTDRTTTNKRVLGRKNTEREGFEPSIRELTRITV